MKKFMSAICFIFSLSSIAFAINPVCPQLAGKYNCIGDHKDFNGDIEVQQKLTPSGMQYVLPVGNVDPIVNIRIADGREHMYSEDSLFAQTPVRIRTSCGVQVLVDQTIISAPPVPLRLTRRYSLSGTQMKISERLIQGANGRVTSAICTRKVL